MQVVVCIQVCDLNPNNCYGFLINDHLAMADCFVQHLKLKFKTCCEYKTKLLFKNSVA